MFLRIEDAKWVNYIGVYFFILEEINKKILELIKYDDNDVEKIELYFFDISVNLNRLIPLKRKKLIKDGVLKLEQYFDFLYMDYKNLFNKYSDELIKINDVRNKFEHCPHQIKWKTYIGNKTEKEIIFSNEEYLNDVFEGNQENVKKKKGKKRIFRMENRNR